MRGNMRGNSKGSYMRGMGISRFTRSNFWNSKDRRWFIRWPTWRWSYEFRRVGTEGFEARIGGFSVTRFCDEAVALDAATAMRQCRGQD